MTVWNIKFKVFFLFYLIVKRVEIKRDNKYYADLLKMGE